MTELKDFLKTLREVFFKDFELHLVGLIPIFCSFVTNFFRDLV